MPLTVQVSNLYQPTDMKSEARKVTKQIIYTAAVGSLAAAFLGGESFSSSTELAGVMIPDPIVAGLGIGIGAGVGTLFEDYVVEKVFQNQPESIRGMERTLVSGGLAVAGGLAGLKYISGIEPSLNAAVLAGGSFVGGSYVQQNLDASLLGMIF